MTNSVAIGHLSTFYHTSFILEGTDWLRKAGLDVTWKLFASGPDMVRAFENKEIDLGYIGLPPAIIGISKGLPLKCIAGGHVEGTVMIGQPDYKSFDELGDVKKVLEQFVGKTVGTPPKGSIHDVIIKDLIDKLHLDVEVKNYAWADFVLGAMTDREIEGAVGTPPLVVASRRFAGSKIVIPPHMLWPNNPSYGIVARGEFMQHPDVILKFLAQHERASNLIREKPLEAAEIVSKLTQIVDPEFVVEAYRISPKYCAALSKEYVQSTMGFVGALKGLGYINRLVREDEIFADRFIKQVHPEPAHYNLI
jgi:NitT/TauT family transport system substrate-binding protein